MADPQPAVNAPKGPRLNIVPLTRDKANDVVTKLHRHHPRVVGHRFAIGTETDDGQLVGVAMAGRPVARCIDQDRIVEVTRVATDGTQNACSKLYGACCRIAAEMGFLYAMTYTLASEPGTSLVAAGWHRIRLVKGRSWDTPSRRRADKHPTEDKVLWGCRHAPEEVEADAA